MRQRLALGWTGSALLSAWLLMGAFALVTTVSVGPAAAPAVAAEEGEGEEAAPPEKPRQNMLMWFYKSLGILYSIVFLFISFNLVALIVMNILAGRRDQIVPAALVEAFEAHVNEKRYQEAYELAKSDESMLGHVLAAGMAKLSGGYDEAVKAMQDAGEEDNMKIEQRLSYVALCGQVGPMFGLLGTVDGMVQAFNKIASMNVTPKPSELADGIGTALVTTMVGLWVAIPAIAFHHFMRNRFQKMVAEVGMISDDLMKRIAGPAATKKA